MKRYSSPHTKLTFCFYVLALFIGCSAFSPVLPVGRRRILPCRLSMTEDAYESGSDASSGDDQEPIIATSTVRIDDGGSDLTNRFNYKV